MGKLRPSSDLQSPAFSNLEMATAEKKRAQQHSTSSAAIPPQQARILHEGKQQNEKQKGPATWDDVVTLISRLTSVVTISFRFLSDREHLLLPSQSFTLRRSLLSAARSLSSLHSLLPQPHFPPPAPPQPSLTPSLTVDWFPRFLASAPDSDPRWREFFRMSKPSFLLLLQTLGPSLPSSTPPERTLAAALFHLAHAAHFHVIAQRFGFPDSAAACRSFYETCHSACQRLGHLFTLRCDPRRVFEGFSWELFLPGCCCGAIGFDRFYLEGADGSAAGSIIIQAVVDAEGRFLDVSAGWDGSLTPAQILPRSKLWTCITNSLVSLSNGISDASCNGSFPASTTPYMLGDSCCPLLSWLLTPYHELSTVEAEAFNAVHERAMELVQKAFGAVRARWNLLSACWKEENAEALPFIIVTSLLLHNFLFMSGEVVPDDNVGNHNSQLRFEEFKGHEDEAGKNLREALASLIMDRMLLEA